MQRASTLTGAVFVQALVVGWLVNPQASREARAPAVAYWGVSNVDDALRRLQELGAAVRDAARDVGDGIRTAIVTDPFGNALGIIENPHFSVADVR